MHDRISEALNVRFWPKADRPLTTQSGHSDGIFTEAELSRFA